MPLTATLLPVKSHQCHWWLLSSCTMLHPLTHDGVIKWKHFFGVTDPLCGEFTGHRWIPPTKPRRGALMFSLICAWTNGVSSQDAGDLRRHHAHYDVTVLDDINVNTTVIECHLRHCKSLDMAHCCNWQLGWTIPYMSAVLWSYQIIFFNETYSNSNSSLS